MRRLRGRLRLFDDTGMSPELRRNLYLIILGITLGQSCFTITGGAALTGFMQMLGGSDFYISLLAAIPVLGGLMQLPASYLVERYRARRGMMIWLGIFQRSMWLLVALVPFVIPGQMEYARIWLLITFVTISGCGAAFVNVSFMSLLADVVPMGIRGRYFAVRGRISTTVGLLGGLLSGYLLDALPGYTGYAVVFTFAAICGVADICCFFFVKWPPMEEKKSEPAMRMLGQVFANKPFMKLTIFACLFFFTVRLAGPFYTVYFLGELQMSYMQIVLLSQVMVSVGTVLTITRWGKLMDSYGTRPVLMLSLAISCTLPIFFNYMRHGQIWLMPFVEILSGIAWGPIELSFQNLTLYHAPNRNRTMFFAVYAVGVQLIGNALAFLVGGYLIENVMPIYETWPSILGMGITRYNGIFALSFVLRFLVLGVFGRLIVGTDESSTLMGMIKGVATEMRMNLARRIAALRIARAKARLRANYNEEESE